MKQAYTAWAVVVALGAVGGAATACGGSSAGGARSSAEFGAGYTRVPATPEIQALEHAMAARLNRDRAALGLATLEYDETLADVARAHSADMRANRFFAHESPTTGTVEDRIARAGYLALETRENLAEGPDVDTAEDGLMASPGHHANIVATTVTHLGIGVVRGGIEQADNYLFTQVFARPGQLESAAVARERIAALIAETRASAGLSPVAPNARLDALAERHIDTLPDTPSPASLKKVGQAIAAELEKKPIPGVAGVSVGGQLLWQSSDFVPSGALTGSQVRHYGLALREVKDEKGRPQLKLLVLFGI